MYNFAMDFKLWLFTDNWLENTVTKQKKIIIIFSRFAINLFLIDFRPYLEHYLMFLHKKKKMCMVSHEFLCINQ